MKKKILEKDIGKICDEFDSFLTGKKTIDKGKCEELQSYEAFKDNELDKYKGYETLKNCGYKISLTRYKDIYFIHNGVNTLEYITDHEAASMVRIMAYTTNLEAAFDAFKKECHVLIGIVNDILNMVKVSETLKTYLNQNQ